MLSTKRSLLKRELRTGCHPGCARRSRAGAWSSRSVRGGYRNGARRSFASFLIAICTQAATDGDLFSLWLDDAANSADPRIVSHLYTAPKDCEITDRKAWAAATLRWPSSDHKPIEDFAAQAERLPAKANSSLAYLNQRLRRSHSFQAAWEANSSHPEVVPGIIALLD